MKSLQRKQATRKGRYYFRVLFPLKYLYAWQEGARQHSLKGLKIFTGGCVVVEKLQHWWSSSRCYFEVGNYTNKMVMERLSGIPHSVRLHMLVMWQRYCWRILKDLASNDQAFQPHARHQHPFLWRNFQTPYPLCRGMKRLRDDLLSDMWTVRWKILAIFFLQSPSSAWVRNGGGTVRSRFYTLDCCMRDNNKNVVFYDC